MNFLENIRDLIDIETRDENKFRIHLPVLYADGENVCVDIIKKVFDGEKAQSIQISTCNGLGEEISTETVSQQKREKALNNIAAKPMVTQTAKSIVCPHCGSKNLDYLTRIIGYLKRVSSFNEARQVEESMRSYT